MSLETFSQLEQRVAGLPRRTVALAAAQDVHALEAVFATADEGLIDMLLVGEPSEIAAAAKGLGRTPAEDIIVPATGSEQAAARAVALVREGRAHMLMKGRLDTATLMRAVLDRDNGLRTGSTISHLAVLQLPNYHKLIAVTDGGMIPYPTLEQKAMIVRNAISCFHRLGYAQPRVAVLAASEAPNPKMPETLDAAALKDMAADGLFGSCILDGPLSYDLVMSAESAKIKGLVSPVCCHADILLVPNIAAGNLLSKCMVYTGGATMAGYMAGAGAPIVLTSRGATAEEKRLSLLLASAVS